VRRATGPLADDKDANLMEVGSSRKRQADPRFFETL